MLYMVRARPIVAEMAKFWVLLNDGTIGTQKPDGSEIVASMKRAVMNEGKVEWQETCFCSPPLRHERTTIYDRFFSDLEIGPSVAATPPKGESFWHYLEAPTRGTSSGHGQRIVNVTRYVPIRIF